MGTKKIFSITKQQLVNMYYPLPENSVRKNINEIIFENRKDRKENLKKSFTEVVSGHYVEKKEVEEFFETYGYPEDLED